METVIKQIKSDQRHDNNIHDDSQRQRYNAYSIKKAAEIFQLSRSVRIFESVLPQDDSQRYLRHDVENQSKTVVHRDGDEHLKFRSDRRRRYWN